MQRISSASTFFSKKVFPVLFFGCLAYFLVDAYRSGELASDPFLIVGMLSIVLVGGFVFRVFVWDLADQVDDHGTYLEVRRGGVTDRIHMSNIMNVSATQFVNPPRVTLKLVKPGPLGREVSFSPKLPLSLGPVTKSAIVEDLTERANAARSKSAA
jgi:hypothetical protein